MNAGRCSKGLAVVSALLFATVASAGWQISSTDDRMVSFDGGPPVSKGPRCTVIFDAGHGVVGDELRLPRGTLEMFVDHDTVAYRKSGTSSLSEPYAPAIQFHRLAPRGSMKTVTPGTPGTPAGPPKPCGWHPDSYYCEEEGDPATPGTDATEEVKFDPFINYVVRSDYVTYMHGMALRNDPMCRDGMDASKGQECRVVVPPPNNIAVTQGFDSGDSESSYWIDYRPEVYSALRMTEGDLSLRVYFPGYINNGETGMRPEHPHYVNWSVDLGMMEGTSNEVFSKLEACADLHMIDGSMAGRGEVGELP